MILLDRTFFFATILPNYLPFQILFANLHVEIKTAITMKNIRKFISFLALCLVACCFSCSGPTPLKALIISGQNNHNWQVSHQAIQHILDNSGLFVTDIALTPPAGGDMSTFTPSFDPYDVVVLDYNGDRWSENTDKAFLQYVQNGGGILIYHAADNAFAGWEEFNRIIALGGWEGRNEKSGPYCYWKDGELVLDHAPGHGGSHGQQWEYVMHGRNSEHPITQGLPTNWKHAKDEMYDSMRGPANIKDLLYTGTADAVTGGSGREEPLVFTVDYGKARISHIMLGHAGATLEDNPAMQCVGFQTLLLRSAEWAATGKVTQPLPADFPTEQTVSLRKDYGKAMYGRKD